MLGSLLTYLLRDAKLLSFGGEEAEDDEEPVKFKKKSMFRDDCEYDLSVKQFGSRMVCTSDGLGAGNEGSRCQCASCGQFEGRYDRGTNQYGSEAKFGA